MCILSPCTYKATPSLLQFWPLPFLTLHFHGSTIPATICWYIMYDMSFNHHQLRFFFLLWWSFQWGFLIVGVLTKCFWLEIISMRFWNMLQPPLEPCFCWRKRRGRIMPIDNFGIQWECPWAAKGQILWPDLLSSWTLSAFRKP